MSKSKAVVIIKMKDDKQLKVAIHKDYQQMTLPVFASALLSLGIQHELEAGTDPFKVLSMCRAIVQTALKSNAIQLLVEMGDKNEDDNAD